MPVVTLVYIKETLKWESLYSTDEYNLVRANFSRELSSSLHDHNFFELFWVDSGKVEHQIEGTNETLSSYTLYFIRPKDTHRLFVLKNQTATITNFSFPAASSKILFKQFENEVARYWDPQNTFPQKMILTKDQVLKLQRITDQFLESPKNSFYFYAAIMAIFLEIQSKEVAVPVNIPSHWPFKVSEQTNSIHKWLDALEVKLEDPAQFHQGVRGLSKISGYSSAYLSRVFRKRFGCTPSDYINRKRAAQAADLLQNTKMSILEIAHECGLSNVAHFYKIFKRFYGTTPGEWQKKPSVTSKNK